MDGDGKQHWTEEQLLAIRWYHPSVDRHLAEVMLRDNGVEGSYLLRPGSSGEKLVVSVRCQTSVQHFEVTPNSDASYHFGTRDFDSLKEFEQHLVSCPAIKGSSGLVTVFEKPYERMDEAEKKFGTIKKHIGGQVHRFIQPNAKDLTDASRPLSYGSREGTLVKKGRIVKNLKDRWFVADKAHLSYYKTHESTHPIRTLDLSLCEGVALLDSGADGLYGFSVAFPKRTFYLFAHSPIDRQAWMEYIQWATKVSKQVATSQRTSPSPAEEIPDDAAEDADDQADD
eukprot:m.203742 g.203742  ORF g.203742 m.203742 type:complete len:284 (+) comp16879_c2_seq1:408-1259(+)